MIAAARKDTTGWASEVLERRDSALVLMGYAGALGRGDLVGLLCGDVTKHPHDGLELRTRRPNGANAIRLPAGESHNTCAPCAALRWMQVVAAFDSGARAAVIRLIKADDPFEEHICGAPLPRTRARAPLFRSIRKNGNLSATPLSGASIHLAVRRHARLAGYDDEFVAGLGVQSLRAGFIAQALRNKADAQSILRQTGHVGHRRLAEIRTGGASGRQRGHGPRPMTLTGRRTTRPRPRRTHGTCSSTGAARPATSPYPRSPRRSRSSSPITQRQWAPIAGA